MHGFLNIDKPVGMTSFDVIRRIRRLLPRKTKIGHLGTLDPMASGVLPLAVGDATRLLSFLGEETKSYVATMILGGVSDTQDAWGTISPTPHHLVSSEEMLQTLPAFTGIIRQIPPMYSAVHHQGRRLYELARQGLEVERIPREIEIYQLEVLELNQNEPNQQARIRVVCSKGTYVRTLCHDIGASLGTGAYMTDLLRTRSGAFSLEQAYRLDDIMERGIREEDLLPLDYPLAHLPEVVLNQAADVRTVLHGGSLSWSGSPPAGLLKIYAFPRILLGIGACSGEQPEVIIRPIRVLAGSQSSQAQFIDKELY